MKTVKTLKLRIKDKNAPALVAIAREVNQVWNYVNELSQRSIRERQTWLSAYDLQKYTAGFSKCEGVKVGSATVQLVCEEYATRRRQFKKARLNWRVSNPKSPKRSLGWIPFKKGGVLYRNGQVKFCGLNLSLWDSYGLSKYELRAGSISQDARGRWYLNVAVEVEGVASEGVVAVGIDLGNKTCATASSGQTLEGRWYRASEAKLAKVQRSGARKQAQREATLQAVRDEAIRGGWTPPHSQRPGKTTQMRKLHAKIRNQRKDALHKFSTKLVAESAAIFVGNVSSKAMVKTNMAKGALDAGWSQFKTMLEYKSHQAGIVFAEINECYSTQTCSQCASIEGPKGLKGLGIREWTCSCGAVHSRDVNAAKNILARGLASLAGGALA